MAVGFWAGSFGILKRSVSSNLLLKLCPKRVKKLEKYIFAFKQSCPCCCPARSGCSPRRVVRSDEEKSSGSEQEVDAGINLLQVKDKLWREDPVVDPLDPSTGLPKYTSPSRMRWDGRFYHGCMDFFKVFFPKGPH